MVPTGVAASMLMIPPGWFDLPQDIVEVWNEMHRLRTTTPSGARALNIPAPKKSEP